MASEFQINEYLQAELRRRCKSTIAAVDAAQWLDGAGILRDSKDRPGRELRRLLREKKVVGGRQEGNNRWFIDWRLKGGGMDCPWYADANSLRLAGFSGFMTIRDLRECKLSCVPAAMGVYVLLCPETQPPIFLTTSTGGRFKGRDPSVSQEVLAAHWVTGSQVVYVGKAGAPGGSATLRSRLRQYLDFGAGRPVGHWGGRYIWHLPSSESLIVCWKPTPDEIPREVEQRMIGEFTKVFGTRPFANLSN